MGGVGSCLWRLARAHRRHRDRNQVEGRDMTIGILEQWRQARRHPVAALLGAMLGGFVPLAAYKTTHGDLQVRSAGELLQPLVPVVGACLLFSVRTVWQWGRGA